MFWQFGSGAFLGWTLGANDAANVFGTSVATRLVTYRVAVILLAVFVMLGAALEGPKCMTTLNEVTRLTPLNAVLVTASAAVVMFFLSLLALPASSSQAVMGALLFIGLVEGQPQWNVAAKVALCWVLTPVSAGLLSALLYLVLGWLLKPILTRMAWRSLFLKSAVIVAGCYGSYTLGSNNVANVSGVYVGAGMISPFAASLFGGAAIALGVLTFSKRVMQTVGTSIMPLDAFSAFISVLALSVSTHLFTQIGVPVSSTQAIVGAVLGIGLLKDSSKIQKTTVLQIVTGWVATPLAGALVCLLLLQLINVMQ
jgi:inorganic phosphate transporter, PiT family